VPRGPQRLRYALFMGDARQVSTRELLEAVQSAKKSADRTARALLWVAGITALMTLAILALTAVLVVR
jgi:hypothetical protein